MLDAFILSPAHEVLQTGLVGHLEHHEVVRFVVPIVSDDGVLRDEAHQAMTRLGRLCSGWKIRANDDVELEGRFVLRANG